MTVLFKDALVYQNNEFKKMSVLIRGSVVEGLSVSFSDICTTDINRVVDC